MEIVLEIATALGLALLIAGWRGRRIDRHPLCAACGCSRDWSWCNRDCR